MPQRTILPGQPYQLGLSGTGLIVDEGNWRHHMRCWHIEQAGCTRITVDATRIGGKRPWAGRRVLYPGNITAAHTPEGEKINDVVRYLFEAEGYRLASEEVHFSPMLAAHCPPLAELVFPLLATPKLDGIRCILKDGQATTRSGNPIPNDYIRETIEAMSEQNLDGEITINGGGFAEAQRQVMSKSGTPDFTYTIFDVFDDPDEPYSQRVQMHPACLQPTEINNIEELLAYERQCLQAGFEGIILREPDGEYHCGRTSSADQLMLKRKPLHDAEGTIVEALADHDRQQISALTIALPQGACFRLGTGFTAAQRRELYQRRESLAGSCVTFSYQQWLKSGKPRFASFIGLRHDHTTNPR